MKKVVLEEKKDKLNFSVVFWIFIVTSIFGAYYEEILHITKYYIINHVIDFSPRRGVFFGPLSPVYGVGAALLTIILVGKDDKWQVTFLKSAFLGGITEYIISFLQEVFLGTTSWNYSGKFLNIGGRTTIPYMIFWGFLGIVFLKIIYPIFRKVIDEIPRKHFKCITNVLYVLVAVDVLISWTALARQTLRHHDIEPITFVGEVYDKYFDDDYIKEKFPNMVRSE